MIYTLLVKDRLDEHWAEWFEGLSLSNVEGGTQISGYLPDQAALHGVLAKIRDLNLTLLSVSAVPDRPGSE